MISIYLDWGIISQLRQGKYPELKELLFQKDKFLIPYSSSHIGDLIPDKNYDGSNEEINKDLNFLSELTENRCFNFYQKKLVLDKIDPRSYYNERIETNKAFDDFGMETFKELSKEFNDPNSPINTIFDKYRDIPIDPKFLEGINNPEWGLESNFFYPDLKDNPTIDGLLKSSWKMFQNLFEEDGYAKLRQITQKGMGVNRDKMFNQENPFGLIEKLNERHGFNPKEHLNAGKYVSPTWFDNFCADYLLLDMYGFQEDKINIGKGRKQTMRNTNDDALHATFASVCHFYIINDKRSFQKTKEVYNKYNLGTIPLSPEDFIKYANNYLYSRSIKDDLQIPFNYFELEPEKITKKENGHKLVSYFCDFYLVDFFNNIHGIVNEEGILQRVILAQALPMNKESLYPLEIETLLEKLFNHFGHDVHGKGRPSAESMYKDAWNDIEWSIGEVKFLLVLNLNSLELHCYLN